MSLLKQNRDIKNTFLWDVAPCSPEEREPWRHQLHEHAAMFIQILVPSIRQHGVTFKMEMLSYSPTWWP